MTITDRDLTAIAELYPNRKIQLDDVTAIRAEARLEQILATDPYPRAAASGIPKPRVNKAWRWATIPAAAAAAVGLSFAIPSFVPPAHASLATWTPSAVNLTGDLLTEISAACYGEISSRFELVDIDWYAEGYDEDQYPIVEPTIAEIRDDWALLSYSRPGLPPDICLVWFDGENPQVAMHNTIWPLGETFGPVLSGEGMAISQSAFDTRTVIDDRSYQPVLSEPETDAIDLRRAIWVDPSDDAPVSVTNDEKLTLVGGQAGDDVIGIRLHTVDGLSVDATISDGSWVAWWPSASSLPEVVPANDGTDYLLWEEIRSNIDWDSPIALGYTLTLRDGTTKEISTPDWQFDPTFSAGR